MIVLLIIACIAVGIGIGYTLAVSTTDRLMARMSDDEIKALADRVRRRRGR